MTTPYDRRDYIRWISLIQSGLLNLAVAATDDPIRSGAFLDAAKQFEEVSRQIRRRFSE
jgi:hypothetical protein